MTAPLPQSSVLGLPVHLSTDYVPWLVQQIALGTQIHVVTLNAEMAMLALQEKELYEVIHQAGLVIPDGAGVVWALGLKGERVGRCPGIELVENLLPRLDPGTKIYLLGAGPGVAEQVARQWQARFPNLALVEARDGYFTAADEPQILSQLQCLQPGLVLVGLGVPKQEYLIHRWQEHLPHTVWVGVGGSFDVWSGTKERAPEWFRRNSLEWLYRLYQEPYRWRRMLALPRFALQVLRQGIIS
ncbi:WecB/TagA/CpsF family glycosyltransferase [Anthocerotibacter panamensis]|uniref:WecB/TagA/CpsF family glycosyltransferase n=1 Tax=Anthocerotibacter panamensis TaxID=2857077 RepID=UPI001C40889A|nr:WecB/TagA/CpsF family glycosyltransferase [Anthocerotibacter panamensis]